MKLNNSSKIKIVIPLLAIFLALNLSGAYAFTTNGTGRVFDFDITSGKNTNISSSSFRTYSVVGDVISTINSSNFKTEVGFLRTLPYLNGEPCQVSAECVGGFCCSNICGISACPVGGGGSGETGSSSSGGGASAAAGGGGGGGGFFTKEELKNDFSVSQDSIKGHLALGDSKTKEITIKNTGNTNLSFSLEVLAVDEFISLSEKRFILEPNQEKAVGILIEGKKLGSYAGEIEISAGVLKKTVSAIIEVESGQILFDVKLDIPIGYKKIAPGNELKTQTTLFNIAGPKKVNVALNYFIKDLKGNVIAEQSETPVVERQYSFTKSFTIPKGAKPGFYVISVEAIYANSFAVSSELFEIAGEGEISGIKIKNLYSKSVLSYFSLAILIILLSIGISHHIPEYREIKSKRLRRNFSMLFAETDQRIRIGQFGEAVKSYRRLDSVYRNILKSSMDNKTKMDMYKNIRSIYGTLARMKNEEQSN